MPKQRKSLPGTVTRTVLVLTVLIAVLVGAIYVGRQPIINAAIERYIDRTGLDELELELDEVARDSTSLHRARIAKTTDTAEVEGVFTRLELGMDLFALSPSYLNIEKADVSVKIIDGNNAASTDGLRIELPVLALPVERGTIDELSLSVAHAGGISQFDGSATWRTLGDKLTLTLDSDTANIVLDAALDASKATLAIGDKDNPEIASLSLDAMDSRRLKFNLKTGSPVLENWINKDPLISARWRELVPQIPVDRALLKASGTLDISKSPVVEASSAHVEWTGLNAGTCRVDGSIEALSVTAKSDGVRVDVSPVSLVETRHCSLTQPVATQLTGARLSFEPDGQLVVKLSDDGSVDIGSQGGVLINATSAVDSAAVRVRALAVRALDPNTGTFKELVSELTLQATLSPLDMTDLRTDSVELGGDLAVSGSSSALTVATRSPFRVSTEQANLNADGSNISLSRLESEATGSAVVAKSSTVEANVVVTVDGATVKDSTINASLKSPVIEAALKGTLEQPTARLRFSAADLAETGTGVTARTLSGTGIVSAANTIELSASGTLDDVHHASLPPSMTAEQLNFDLRIEEDRTRADGVLTVTQDAEARWSLATRPNDKHPALNIDFQSAAASLLYWGRDALPEQAQALTVNDGQIKLKLSTDPQSPQDNTTFGARLELDNIAGKFGELGFSGASVSVNSSSLADAQFGFDARIDNGSLANDMPFTDLRVRGSADRVTAVVDEISIALLGGKISSGGFTSPVAKPAFSSNLDVAEIEIGELVTAISGPSDESNIEANGRLAGTLPMTLGNSRITITNGRLDGTTGGRIAYTPGSGATPVDLDNIALQALEDFNYKTLGLTLNYTNAGDYTVNARLEGNNPGLYDGYPIAFNLNINGTLPGLIEGWLTGGKFDEKFLRDLKQTQTQTPTDQQSTDQ